MDRPRPWVQDLPEEFNKLFTIGLYKKEIILNSDFDIDREVTPEMPLPKGISFIQPYTSVQSVENGQIVWAATMNPFECGDDSRCIAILGKKQTVNGVQSQPYIHYRVSKMNPETNQVIRCDMNYTKGIKNQIGVSSEVIALSECFLYSKNSCAAWSDYMNKSKDHYQQLKFKRASTPPDYNTLLDSTVTFQKNLVAIFKAPDGMTMKRSLTDLTNGNGRVRWEPRIKTTALRVGGTFTESQNLLKRAEMCTSMCAKYETFFMTDQQRDIWNRSHPGVGKTTDPSSIAF